MVFFFLSLFSFQPSDIDIDVVVVDVYSGVIQVICLFFPNAARSVHSSLKRFLTAGLRSSVSDFPFDLLTLNKTVFCLTFIA